MEDRQLSPQLFILRLHFSSVTQLCPTLCDSMDCSTPGLPVHHKLPKFTQTHVHQVGDAIQPSHPLSSPSPPAPNPSQHQGLFQWVNSSHEVAKVLEFQLQHQSFQKIFRTDFLLEGLAGSPCSLRDSQESSPAPQFKSINSSMLSFLYSPTLTSTCDHWKNHSLDQTDLWGLLIGQWSCMDVRVGLWRKLSAKELMLFNCGVGEDSWESLGLQGDPTSPS